MEEQREGNWGGEKKAGAVERGEEDGEQSCGQTHGTENRRVRMASAEKSQTRSERERLREKKRKKEI